MTLECITPARQHLLLGCPSHPAHPPESQWVFRSSAISCLNPKSGRWREPPIQSFPCRTGHRPDLSQLLETALQKNTVTFRMSHGFDFATQNLGPREECPHLIRKQTTLTQENRRFSESVWQFFHKNPTQENCRFSEDLWQLYRLGFDFGVRMWYSEEEEGSAPGRLHVCDQ